MNGSRLEWIDPKTLTPNPKNWRRHPEHQRDALADVLGEVGWAGAALYNEQTGKLVDGHLRLDVALRRGDEAIPVLVGSWDEADEAKILATLDPIAALATADAAALDSLLREVNTGSAAVMDMLAELAEGAGLYAEPVTGAGGDEFDTTPDDGPARAQRGDLWQMGEHRLLVDDCTKRENVARLMGGDRAAIAFTSPPYNVAAQSSLPNKNKYRQNRTNTLSDSDARTTSSYLDLLTAFTEVTLDVAEYLFVNVQSVAGNKVALIDYLAQFRDRYADTIIWDKLSAEPAMAHNVLNSQFEYVHVLSAKATRAIGTSEFRGTLSNVVSLNSRQEKENSGIHRATFPTGFATHFVDNFSCVGEAVLDPFAGTGTALIAAERLGRKCYGCEIEPRYADVILRRWEAETGKEAVLLERVAALESIGSDGL
jgi:DNA modification methylase